MAFGCQAAMPARVGDTGVHVKKEIKATAIRCSSEVAHGDWVCISSSWLKDSDSDPEGKKQLPGSLL